MADKEQVKSARERFAERLKSKYPDKEYADDEALFGQIVDDYDGYDSELKSRDERIGGYEEERGRLTDLMTSNPKAADFLSAMVRGEDPLESMIKVFGGDLKEALDDPEKAKELSAAFAQHTQEAVERSSRQAEIAENLEKLGDTCNEVEAELGVTAETVDKAALLIEQIGVDYMKGLITKEHLSMVVKAVMHDADVAQASQEAEVRGRNAKITEKVRKSVKNDGTAALGGKNGGYTPKRNAGQYGALDRNYGVEDIWGRGGEKRTRR